MSLTKDRQERLKLRFKEKRTNNCLSCGSMNFLLSDMISLRSTQLDRGYETVAFVCGDCGHFDIYHIDILDKQDGQKT